MNRKSCTAVLAGLLAAATLAGCAPEQAPSLPESAREVNTAQVTARLTEAGQIIHSDLAAAFMGVLTAQTPETVYECRRVGDHYLLCGTDLAVGVCTPVCAAEGCAHAGESCPAFTRQYRETAVAGDWLLTGGWGEDGLWFVDARPLAGGEAKILLEGQKEAVSLTAMGEEDGRLWLAVEGKAALVDPESGTVEAGAALPEPMTPMGAMGGCILHRTDDSAAMLEKYYRPTGDLAADAASQQEILDRSAVTLLAWDPRTGEDTAVAAWVAGDYDQSVVWNGKLIRHRTGQPVFESLDLATGVTETLTDAWPAEMQLLTAYVRDGRLFLEVSWSPEPDRSDLARERLFALDLAGGGLAEITLRNRGGDGTALPRVMGESEDRFYCICTTHSGNEPEGSMATISKADYYAGVDSMEPVTGPL